MNEHAPEGSAAEKDTAISAITREIEYYFQLAKGSGDKRVKRARRWHEIGLGLNVSAAILATAAGATVLGSSQYRLLAGFLALGAALASTLTAALAPAETSQRNLRMAANYLQVADNARVLRAADLPYMSREEAREALKALIADYQRAQNSMVTAEESSSLRTPPKADRV